MATLDEIDTLETLLDLGVLTPAEFQTELDVLGAERPSAQAVAASPDGVLSAVTGLSLNELSRLADAAPGLYRRHPIPKSSGGVRWLCAPEERLKSVQRRVLDGLLYQLSPHPCAHGFVPGRSVLTHAVQHTGKRWVIGLDISRFFDETTNEAASSVFRQLPGIQPHEVDLLCRLCCVEGGLPQGAPTSPCIANLYFRPADAQLLVYARENRLRYSRYADDLALSGPHVPDDLVDTVTGVCETLGYRLAGKKTRVLGSGARQIVTGLVVNQRVHVTRRLRRRLRAILHDARHRGLSQALDQAEMSQDQLTGLLGWVSLSDPGLGQRLRNDLAVVQLGTQAAP